MLVVTIFYKNPNGNASRPGGPIIPFAFFFRVFRDFSLLFILQFSQFVQNKRPVMNFVFDQVKENATHGVVAR